MTTDKTLADVQPGGRVRLQQAPPPEGYAGAWIRSAYGQPSSFTYWNMEVAYAAGWQAALSAQPSPGGQGEPVGTIRDRDGVFEIELSESAHDTDAGALDGRAVYLAGRQPGGQGDSRSTRAATFLRQYLTYLRSSPRHGLRPRWCDVYEALEIAIEALSAQPSPGGQGDAQHVLVNAAHLERVLVCAEGNHFDDCMADRTTTMARAIEQMREALAARQPVAATQPSGNSGELAVDTQPVGEPVGTVHSGKYASGMPWCEVEWHIPQPAGTKLYAAPPGGAE